MHKPPYIKRHGRYIPRTQSGNRDFYYNILSEIMTFEKFDPNSTYGKYIFKKIIFDLRKYRNLKRTNKENKGLLRRDKERFEDLVRERKQQGKYIKNNIIEEKAKSLVEINNPLLALFNSTSFLIAFGFTYVFLDISKLHSSWLFFVFPLFWYIIVRFIGKIYDEKKKPFRYEMKNKLKNKSFTNMPHKEKKEIEEKEINIIKQEKEINILKNKIIKQTKKLLSEDKLKFILSDEFYNSTDWKKIRNKAFTIYKNICAKCGSTDNLAVDHIKPRSKFPEKGLDISNTQILCLRCNSSKGNK